MVVVVVVVVIVVMVVTGTVNARNIAIQEARTNKKQQECIKNWQQANKKIHTYKIKVNWWFCSVVGTFMQIGKHLFRMHA